MTDRIKNLFLGLVLIPLLGGCSSIAEGITKGLMSDSGEKEDTRSCDVSGHVYKGLEETMVRQEDYFSRDGNPENRPTLKVLMIHGIGSPIPGYSTRFSTNFTRELKLDVKEEFIKHIDLKHPLLGEEPLGTLAVSRFFNKDKTREMIFYELTWSNIIEKEKSRIYFDNSGTYTYKRAGINNILKGFINDHAPDPMIYLGNSRMSILRSVGQSLCWMMSKDWEDLEHHQNSFCDATIHSLNKLAKDDFSIITHSLGSRIIIDSLQALAFQTAGFHTLGSSRESEYEPLEEGVLQSPKIRQMLELLREEEIPIFMLANQLPLLQLGRKDPEVTGQIQQYCRKEGPNYHKRLFKELNIMAFSDPNDLLSYEITPEFAMERMDSRICPRTTNVSINIAEVVSLLGVGDIANPGEAHTGYAGDERVIKLIVHGIGHDGAADLIKERCTFLKVVHEKSKRPVPSEQENAE